MSGVSFVLNRLTKSARGEFADWLAERAADFVEPADREQFVRTLRAGVMVTTALGMSVICADVAGIFDPGSYIDAVDAATAVTPGDVDLTQLDVSTVDPSHLDAAKHADGLKFGRDGEWVNPGESVIGHTPDGHPVTWWHGPYDPATGEHVTPT